MTNEIFIDIFNERFPHVIDARIFNEQHVSNRTIPLDTLKPALDKVLALSFIMGDEDGHPKGPITDTHVRNAIQMLNPHVIFYEKMNF
jgi:hypothetical protein